MCSTKYGYWIATFIPYSLEKLEHDRDRIFSLCHKFCMAKNPWNHWEGLKLVKFPLNNWKGFWGPQFQALLLHDLPLGVRVNITLWLGPRYCEAWPIIARAAITIASCTTYVLCQNSILTPTNAKITSLCKWVSIKGE